MITQEQIKELSKSYKINESVVTREFIQIVFLKELYEKQFARAVFFKGGTAIRLLYGGKRFSEDLDFTVEMDELEFKNKLNKLFNELEKKYPFKFKERETITGKTFLLTATIPFLKSNVYVKLDFSTRENVLHPVKNLLNTEYPVIVQSFIHSLGKNEIIAEKIRAILKREKQRDLYDLWILHTLGGKIDRKMVVDKLLFYNEKFNPSSLVERIKSFSKEGFIKDLKPFVPINEREKLRELFEYVVAYLENSILKITY